MGKYPFARMDGLATPIVDGALRVPGFRQHADLGPGPTGAQAALGAAVGTAMKKGYETGYKDALDNDALLDIPAFAHSLGLGLQNSPANSFTGPQVFQPISAEDRTKYHFGDAPDPLVRATRNLVSGILPEHENGWPFLTAAGVTMQWSLRHPKASASESVTAIPSALGPIYHEAGHRDIRPESALRVMSAILLAQMATKEYVRVMQ